MAVALRGSGSNGGFGDSVTVTTSAGAVDGDLILIFVNTNNDVSGAHPTPAASGFTSLGSSTASVWSRTTVLGRIASGNGSSYTITGIGTVNNAEVAVVILSGADSALPTNIVTTPDASSNTTFSIPAITNAAANSLDVACVGYGGNVDQGLPPNLSGWGGSLTGLIDDAFNVGGGNCYAGLGVATATRASSGSQAATSVTAAVADVNAAIRIEVLVAGGATATSDPPPRQLRMPLAILAR
ncbi:MAG TPA: hypothetical protein VFD32_05535 [Dehalococcoidia bacterium]|nr:hypothetical protein [Dehalococcoidia bacterium]